LSKSSMGEVSAGCWTIYLTLRINLRRGRSRRETLRKINASAKSHHRPIGVAAKQTGQGRTKRTRRMIPRKARRGEIKMRLEKLSMSKEANCLSPTWPGAAKKNCASILTLWQRCDQMLKSMSYTESSACRKKMFCRPRRRCESCCASPSLKVWTEQCSRQSNTTNISTQKSMSSRQPSTSKGDYRQIPSTMTKVKQSPASLRRSSASSQTGRVETRCSVLPHRASGNSTSVRESSADRSGFKPTSIQRWIVNSLSLNSNRD
jgi:hypothetical protein